MNLIAGIQIKKYVMKMTAFRMFLKIINVGNNRVEKLQDTSLKKEISVNSKH